ncbi:ArnT family glycosyltransferase [Desulfococcus sp.]|uniref:ArnT family glycosyltransferase n=1 Tax=Desulfococcus sp. TaxID=2025834 RepID=UPI0035947565
MTQSLPEGATDRRMTAVFGIFLLLLISAVVLLSLVPPISRDALVHHLNIPKLYLLHGKMVEFPSMSFSYFPMNLDLLYMISLWLGNDIAPKFIHFSFALLTAWLIYDYLKPRAGKNYALIGALFFLSTPIVIKLSITVYVDLGLIFFSTAALLLLFRWEESGFSLAFLTGSAVCCGLAMGTKYNGLIVCFLLTAFVPWIYSSHGIKFRHPSMKAIAYGALYLAVALMVFSPWMIRNWHWKGNPVYPLYDSVFNPPKTAAKTQEGVTRPKAAKGLFSYRSVVYEETEWQMLLLPVRIFFEGQDGSGQYFDGKLNPFLLLFTVLAFVGVGISHRRNREGSDPGPFDPERWLTGQKKMLLSFAILYFLFALFSTVLRIRYLSPMIPPLVILSVFGMKSGMVWFEGKLGRERRSIARIAGGAILIACLGLNVHYIWTQFNIVDPFDYLAGKVSRDEYITRYRPEYPVMQYANRHLSEDARILFIFMGKRGYYCDRPYLLDDEGRPSLMAKIVNRSDSPEEIASRLRESKITHLMLQSDIFNRWVTEDFTAEKGRLFMAFLRRQTTLLYSHHLFGLLAVTPPGKAAVE